MTFQDAVKKSIKQFMDGKMPNNLMEVSGKSIKQFMDGKMPNNLMEVSGGEVKYTPEYFDGFKKAMEEEGDAPEVEETTDED